LEASQQRLHRHQTTQLREAALSDLNFWANRLGKPNGLPINDGGSEVRVTVTMSTDASGVGYGAHCGVEGSEISGNLLEEMLGRSSTARDQGCDDGGGAHGSGAGGTACAHMHGLVSSDPQLHQRRRSEGWI
jgi:hypothetical protein